MEEFIYSFGYEDPIAREVNQRLNTDYESAIVIRISAENETKAKEWGDEIAEKFIKFLYNDQSFSWKDHGFGSGIESEIDDYLKEHWDKIPKVKYGEYPNIETLEEPYD
jgi:ribose 1,5-bisphosphokinase PhnN